MIAVGYMRIYVIMILRDVLVELLEINLGVFVDAYLQLP